jgi:hypothetical protein
MQYAVQLTHRLANNQMRGVIKMAFKNKQELINFVKTQVNVELNNEINGILNKKRKILYTQIDMRSKYSVLPLLEKYGIRYETHLKDNYWIWIS